MELDLGFGVELKASLDGLTASTTKLAAELAAARRRAERLPTHNRAFGVATANSAGACTLDLDGPQPGRYWLVRSIVVGGTGYEDAPAGSAAVYVLIVPAGAVATAGTLQMRDNVAGALPQVAFYGSEQMLLHAREHLIVTITSGTSGQQYVAAATIEDWPDLITSQELM